MSAIRRSNTSTVCVARRGKLCRCETCTSSFVSTATTVSDVSTTCPPDIDERSQDFETPSRARYQPLQVFPTNTTLVESVHECEDNESSVGKFTGPDGGHTPPCQNSLNLSLGRALTLKSLARNDSVSSVASDRTARSPKAKALQRNESVITNTTVDDYEYEEPATYLPPMQVPTRAIRTQRLGPTRSNYNLTPTAAFPLGRPANRKRWEGAKLSTNF